MVRVIQAHNFKSQQTFNVPDDLLTACLISSERILIARKDGTIELKSLSINNKNSDDDNNKDNDINYDQISKDNEFIHSFHTVSDLEQMLYSTTGHYILTLELATEKQNDDNTNDDKIIDKNVRAYINWDPEFIQTISIHVRARLASRVTPSISDRDRYFFEMIELPVQSGIPKCIACCQITGNIAIGLDNSTIIFYKFLYRTIDKKPYIDFEQLNYFVQIEYIPDMISITENIIVTMNKYCLNAFKIIETLDNTDDISDVTPPEQSTIFDLSQNVDFKELLKMDQKNSGSLIIHGTSNIPKMNKNLRNRHEIKPTRVYDLLVCLCTYNKTEKKFIAKTLLKLRMKSEKNNVENQQDFMKLISVRPMYLKSHQIPEKPEIYKNSFISCSFTNEKDDLRSQYYRDYLGCGLIVTTAEDGYLYLLEKNEKLCDDGGEMLLETFSFTAPLIDIVLEDALLYVITSVGLEIYTSKIGHYLFSGLMEENSSMINSPNTEFPVCSVDMRPFFGVRYAFTSNSTLVLLAHSPSRDNSGNFILPFTGPKWTLYNLELPEPDELVKEFSQKALYQSNTDDFPAGYTEHLLGEAHVFIRLVSELSRIIPYKSPLEMKNSPPILFAELSSIVPDNILKAYNNSCIQLGDYYMMKTNQKEYSQAAIYYTMGNIDITMILERALKKKNSCVIGLIYTLKRLLRSIFHNSNKIGNLLQTGYSIDSLGNSTNFLETLLDLMIEYTPDEVSKLAMQSTILREHLREKFFTFLSNKIRTTEDNICLILYYIQLECPPKFNQLLKNATEKELFQAMLPNWIIFFDTSMSKYGHRVTSLSDFSEYCINTELIQIQNSFINIFIQLIIKLQIIKLDLIVKLFTDYIASHIGTLNGNNAQKLLKLLLENFFYDYFQTNKLQQTITNNTTLTTTVNAGQIPTIIGGINDITDDITNDITDNYINTIINSPNDSIQSTILSSISSSDTSDDINLLTYKNKHLIDSLQILLRTYLDEWRKIENIDKHQQQIVVQKSTINTIKTNKIIIKRELSKIELEQMFIIKRKFMENIYIIDKWKQTYGNTIICLNKRKKYLDLIPPFFDNYLSFVDDEYQQKTKSNSSFGTKKYDHIRTVLIKIESILCCDLMTNEIFDEVRKFIMVNKQLSGIDGIMSCVLMKDQAIDYLLNNCPQCLTQYGQERFLNNNEWSHLVDLLFNKLQIVSKNPLENSMKYSFYYMIMKELLEHIVTTKSYEDVKEIFPKDEVLKILYGYNNDNNIIDGSGGNSNGVTNDNVGINIIDDDKTTIQKNDNQPLDIFLEYLHKSYNMKQSEKPKQVITNTVRGLMRSQNKNNEMFTF